MAGIFLSHVHYSTPVENNFRHRIEFGNYNTRWGMVIAIIAIGIKSTKTWYLQQKENLEILKKKNRTAIQLQKARLHPEFLLRSLDTIYMNLQSATGKAPSIILKLSDLLSYSLYENSKNLVLLEKEIEQLNNFMALEQQGTKGTINSYLQTGSTTSNHFIVPLVIIKLLEETTALLHTREQAACLQTLQIAIEKSQLSITLLIHPLYNEPVKISHWPYVVENTQKRLLEYYSPNNFQLYSSENEQEIAIRLRLTLADAPGMPPAFNITTKTTAYDRV